MMMRADNMEILVHDLNNQRHVFHIPRNSKRTVRDHCIEFSYKKEDGRIHRIILSLFGLPYIEIDE